MIFADRYQAGELLAKRLSRHKLSFKKTVVAAVPRGGVVVGIAISKRLRVPVRTIVIKKIGAPNNAELAIGATASFGKPVLDHWLIADLDVSADYIKKEVLNKKKEAKTREKLLNIKILPEDFRDKIVIVVDDGLATGQTAKAAAKIIRSFRPKQLILAVPCASPSAVNLIRDDYDNVICLNISPDFMAVGQFYRDFAPVGDLKVKELLARTNVVAN